MNSISSLGSICIAAGLALCGVPALAVDVIEKTAAAPDAPIRAPKVWQATVNASKLNVRGGPGDGFKVVETLELGANVGVVGQSGTWVRLDRPDEAWVARNFLKLPSDFLTPLFRDADNAFLDWAAATGNFEELSVEAEGRLSVILTAALYADLDKLEKTEKEVKKYAQHRELFAWIISPGLGLLLLEMLLRHTVFRRLP